MKIFSQITILNLLLSILIFGCKSNHSINKVDEFALFTCNEALDSASGSIIVVPTVTRYITISKDLQIDKKIDILLDSISKNSFNNLRIENLGINANSDGYKSLKINLRENPGFVIPDSIGNYRSWYDFFQGSMGGQSTTIVLTESILQRKYKGDWIDEIEFYYQNEKIGEWDHIFLSGKIKRK